MRLQRRGTLEITQAGPLVGLAFVEAALASETDDCILWPFSISRKDHYPRITKDSKRYVAHRYVCSMRNGPAAPGMEAAHSCGQNRCVNPRHVRWATPMENTRDKYLHGTVQFGEAHHHSILKNEQVRTIKYGTEPARDLAARFGVRTAVIYDIRRGRIWKHI